MKKIYALLAIFLCIGMVAPVYAASIENATVDSWGRVKVIEDGNVIYFNQKVAVTESPLSYDFAYKVIENCTVTIKTNGDVVIVDENGASIVSTNGFGFRFSEDVRLNFMAWNNFPLTGVVEEKKEPVDPPVTPVTTGNCTAAYIARGSLPYIVQDWSAWTINEFARDAETLGTYYVCGNVSAPVYNMSGTVDIDHTSAYEATFEIYYSNPLVPFVWHVIYDTDVVDGKLTCGLPLFIITTAGTFSAWTDVPDNIERATAVFTNGECTVEKVSGIPV